ncbi:hypothetical protein [Sphingomonas melonis]|uniref:Uncharacterized protein n=1 Tax=Sphingomonas melonis TaxID=152682 RepID=A0A7Y9FQU8_9SPHN|nr:hypothetical protein [Sphingomonas melonis]NYD91633.1 hypothetical protein [Sphingomonas melonis]
MSSTNELNAYLTANPGKTPRDYKGKDTAPFDNSHVAPGEKPFDLLDRDHVRLRADGVPARLLPRNIRQAAGRDKGMRWDEATRSYRLAPTGKAGGSRASAVQYLDSSGPRASAPESAPADLDSAVGRGRLEVPEQPA